MDATQAILLGIIQGLTEFLPVSSSGHLVIFQHLFGLKTPELFFDVCVHTGTLAAVIIFFRTELISVLRAVYFHAIAVIKKRQPLMPDRADADLRLAGLIVVGSIPTAIIGLLFHRIAERLFSSPVLAGSMLILTGVVLWLTRYIKTEGVGISSVSPVRAMGIGLVQGIAIIPGISRSGSTIAAGLFLNLNRQTATRFSFLLSIPAIFGAQILSLKDLADYSGSVSIVVLGTMIAFFTGYIALRILVIMVDRGKLFLFSPYCLTAGFFAIFYFQMH